MTLLAINAHCVDDEFIKRINTEFQVVIKDDTDAPWEWIFEGNRANLIAMHNAIWATSADEFIDETSTLLSEA